MCDGPRRKLVILYGSETGTAQGVAERVYRESKRLHFETHLSTMDDYRQIFVQCNSRNGQILLHSFLEIWQEQRIFI